MQVIAQLSAFCCNVPSPGPRANPRLVIGGCMSRPRPLKSPDGPAARPHISAGHGTGSPPPASHVSHGFSFPIPGSDKIVRLWAECEKRQTRQKKARFPGAGLGTVAGLGCRAPKRSGGLKGRPRNTGTCSDLQGQPCRGFKWHPAAAVSSGRSAGLLRKPGPVHHVDPGWPRRNPLDLLSSEVEVTTLYSVPV